MAKLTSLEDLGRLLSESERTMLEGQARSAESRKGYDGRPQKLEVRLDSKRRRGKTVTLVSGFQSTPDELEEIAMKIKRSCGAGGTVLDNAIVIQGDHRTAIIEMLKKLGYQIG
ncbi:MAG TPA: translation initiation factor [Candidatus Kapabacteria bacterium]|nr:translation initiation factor [Candidatus Kapabacteria bacterium]